MKLFALALVALIVPASALADAAAGMKKSASCTTCHGNDGNSAAAAYPNLAGQTSEYLVKQMKDLKEGRRVSQVMSTMIQIMSDQDIQDLADYFAAQVPAAGTFHSDPDKVAEGKKLVEQAKCTSCHMPNFRGAGVIPRVSRQQYNYTVKQLKDFRDGIRTNDGGLMAPYAKSLTDDQIRAIVHYLSTL